MTTVTATEPWARKTRPRVSDPNLAQRRRTRHGRQQQVPVDEALGPVLVNTTKNVIGHIADLSC